MESVSTMDKGYEGITTTPQATVKKVITRVIALYCFKVINVGECGDFPVKLEKSLEMSIYNLENMYIHLRVWS